jgi:hypothetical protein
MKVNHKHYALFNYSPYLDRNCKEIERPTTVTFDLGDVVYIKSENSIGVVIGCVSESTGEVRTDMDGMQWHGNLELATKEHFEKAGVQFTEMLYKELFGGLEYAVTDKLLEEVMDKYDNLFDELRQPFIQFAKEKTFTLDKKNNIYVAYSSEKDRMVEFAKQKDAVAFFTDLGFTLVK